jgi:hypothetical protein
MKTTRKLLAVGLVVSGLWIGTPASAHPRDLMRPANAGPIRRGETTMDQMRDWFGRPSGRQVVMVGCERVIRARWGRKLMVYAGRDEARTVAAIFVRARRIHSAEHGDLAIHTKKGLRVGDGERKLRRLYPRARPITHAGHTHYRLVTGRFDAYLMAKVVDNRVVQLEAWPYEFC